jgi:glutathione S-transferase
MKLYFSPGACSLAPHILLQELGLSYTPVKVDLRTHKLPDGSDYHAVNPKGYVPMLELDDGENLTEAAVILQYLADRKPGTLTPAAGKFERYRQAEWLNFIATEIHKGFSPLWYPDTPEATRRQIVTKLDKRFDHLAATLEGRPFIAGDKFTAADAYLYTILSWAAMLKVDLSRWPALASYLERIGARPAVREAKRIEAGGRIAAAA